MIAPHNPYAKNKPTNITTNDDDNVSMWETIPSSKDSGGKDKQTEEEDEQQAQTQMQDIQHQEDEEEIKFKENPFQTPFVQSTS